MNNWGSKTSSPIAWSFKAIGERPAHVWTPLECSRLAGMWNDGLTVAQIATALGEDFTRDMVIGKAHRLGLAKRPSPIKRAQRDGGARG